MNGALAGSRGERRPVVTGPNSMGIRSEPGGYDATFIPAERMTPAAAYAAVVETVLDDPAVDLAVVGCVPFTPSLHTLPDQVGTSGSLPDRLAALAGLPTPWVAVVDGGRKYDAMADRLEGAGVPVLRSMDRAVRLLARYAACRSGSGC